MSELTTGLLRSATQQELAELLPAPVWLDDFAAVVLRTAGDEMVEVYMDDQLVPVSTQVLYVLAMTDPARSREVLCAAVKHLATARQEAIDRNDELKSHHAGVLEQIRQYAIERHEADDICRDGLDRFLDEFDLAPYSSRIRVDYTLTGHYIVDNSDDEDVYNDTSKFLRPCLADLDDVDADSAHFDLEFTTSMAE